MLKHIKTTALAFTAVLLAGAASQPAAAAMCEPYGSLEMSEFALVTAVQEGLALRGIDPGSFDGVYGPQTRGAIRKYQRAHKMDITGCPSKYLLEHLNFGTPYTQGWTSYHKYEAVGVVPSSPIADVQQELTRRGYYLGVVDGVMGPKTRAAIVRFQKDAGWPVTGYMTSEQFYMMTRMRPSVRGDGMDTRYIPDKITKDFYNNIIN